MYQREEGRAKVDNEKQDLGMEKAMQFVIIFNFHFRLTFLPLLQQYSHIRY